MKRLILSSVFLCLALLEATPALARVRVVNGRPRRTRVVVHRGFPIRRAIPICVVRPARTVVVVRPRMYLAPVVWTARVASLPPRERLVWEDSEKLVNPIRLVEAPHDHLGDVAERGMGGTIGTVAHLHAHLDGQHLFDEGADRVDFVVAGNDKGPAPGHQPAAVVQTQRGHAAYR